MKFRRFIHLPWLALYVYFRVYSNSIILPRSLGCDLPRYFAAVLSWFLILYFSPTEFCQVLQLAVSLQHNIMDHKVLKVIGSHYIFRLLKYFTSSDYWMYNSTISWLNWRLPLRNQKCFHYVRMIYAYAEDANSSLLTLMICRKKINTQIYFNHIDQSWSSGVITLFGARNAYIRS